MFRSEFYDDLTRHLYSPWWMFLFLGLNFILLGVLIILLPELLAYLVAAFLIINGITFLGLSWSTWKIKHNYRKWRQKHTIPVQ